MKSVGILENIHNKPFYVTDLSPPEKNRKSGVFRGYNKRPVG